MTNSKERFTDRVENYVKYRPHYPEDVIEVIKKETGLKPDYIIADVGSGTGISCKLFLENGNKVYGVEPNKKMREAGEVYLKKYDNFISVNGSAEDTTLESRSVDMIVAAQAFHWFDAEKCAKEFRRILKKDGYIVLMWNVRQVDCSKFQQDYERIITIHAVDYNKVRHNNITREESAIKQLFGGDYKVVCLKNSQELDLEGMEGRLLSSSYIPSEGEARENVLKEIHKVFFEYRGEETGKVTLEYETRLYIGKAV